MDKDEKIETEEITLDNGEKITVDKEPELCMLIHYDKHNKEFIPIFFDETIQKLYAEGHEIDFVMKMTEAIDWFVEAYLKRLVDKEK